MTDERDHGDGAIKRSRALRRFVDARGPSGSRLPQHPWDGSERLARGASGIDEPSAVKVIACHVSRASGAASIQDAGGGGTRKVFFTYSMLARVSATMSFVGESVSRTYQPR